MLYIDPLNGVSNDRHDPAVLGTAVMIKKSDK